MPNRKDDRRPGGAADADLLRRTLDHVATAIIIVGRGGAVLDFNQSAAAIVRARAGLSCNDRVIHATVPAADRKLHSVMTEAIEAVGHVGRCFGILRLPRGDGAAQSLHVCVVSLREQAAGLFIIDPLQEVRIRADLLREVFDLSPAEARVAVELMAGRNAREISKRLDVSVHTVRTHLRSVLAKTAAGSQRNLTRLLARGLGSLHLDT